MIDRATVLPRAGETLADTVAIVGLAAALVGLPASVDAQGSTRGSESSWQVPRTLHGHPDLQGNWTNATLTPFEREEGLGPVYTREQVERLERSDADCPPNPGTVACGRSLGTGTDEERLRGQEYPEVYWDRGSLVAVVGGEPRTSLVTRPSNGRRPQLTQGAEQRLAEASRSRSRFAEYDHAELRPLGERCMSGASAGPPMIPNGAYNNNYTIVQTADYVLIATEMVHDARVIRLGEPAPLPRELRPWFGDSWGRWRGDTLVVETTNLSPSQPFRGVPFSPSARVIERFTRVDEETIGYEFTIDDPETYHEVWGGEIPFKRFDDLLYEYACHEGNYALSAVLSGARYEERVAGDALR